MLGVLLVVAVAASPRELTLAAPGLNYVGVSQQQGDVYLDYFAQQVSKRGIHVTTRGDVQAQLGLERQKQLLGCSESSCMPELMGALGVSAVVVGSLATAGSGFVVNIKVMEASGSTRAIAVYSERLPNEDRLYAYLEASAEELASTLKKRAEPPTTLRSISWLPIGVGVLAGATAGVLFGAAKGIEGDVRNAFPSVTSLDDARIKLQTAVTLQTSSIIVGAVGFGVLLVGAGFALFGGAPEGTPSVSFALQPSGGAVVLTWGLP